MIADAVLVLLIGYMAMSAWSILFNFKRPVLMPFRSFKFLCSFGKKISLDRLPEGMDGLAKMQFADVRYRDWFNKVLKSGEVTNLQLYCFNQQRLSEIDEELRRRGIKPE